MTARRPGQPHLQRAWRLGGPAAVALIGAAALVGSWVLRRDENARADDRRQDLVDTAVAEVEAELNEVTATLVGAGAVVGADGVIDSEVFAVYARQALADSGAAALAAEQRIDDRERASFERRTGRPITDVGEDGFQRAARRDSYCPVVDVAPLDDSTRALLGFDVCGNEQRRPVREQAASTFGVVMSPVIAGQPNGRLAVFLVRSLRQPGTIDVADVVGFVSAGFAVDDLVAPALDELPEGVELRIVADDVVALGDAQATGVDASTRLELFGRTWTFQMVGGVGADHTDSWAAVAGGLGLAVVVAAILARRGRYERAIESLGEKTAADARRFSLRATITAELADAASLDEIVAVTRRSLEGSSGVTRVLLTLDDPDDGPIEELGTPGPPDLDGDARSPAPFVGRAIVGSGLLSLHVWTTDESAPPTAEQVDDVAQAVAAAIDRTNARAVEHALVARLQRSLLSLDLPTTSAVAACRYRAADLPLRVGGDWYDVVSLADDRIAVIVGDVVGHGVVAAVAMAHLRSALSAGASEVADPAAALDALDRFATRTPGASGASVAYAVVDTRRGAVTYCAAGHPPPLVVDPDGSARFLDDGRRPLLGIRQDGAESPLGTSPFPPGSTLLLYTDGLVERRGEVIDVGLDRLARAAGVAGALPSGALCDRLIEDVADAHHESDDVALVALRTVVSNARIHVDAFVSTDGVDASRSRLRGWLDAAGPAPAGVAAIVEAVDGVVAEQIGAVEPRDPTAIIRLEAGVVDHDVVIAVSSPSRPDGSPAATPAVQRELHEPVPGETVPYAATLRHDDRGTTVTLTFIGVGDP